MPCKLVLPEIEPIETLSLKEPQLAEELIRSQLEAACNVFYLISIDTESLTGPEAIKRACAQFLEQFHRKLGVSEQPEERGLKRSGSKKKTKNKEKLDEKNDKITTKFNESFNDTKENLSQVKRIDPDINGIVVYFKVSSTGISLTDNTHRYAYRRFNDRHGFCTFFTKARFFPNRHFFRKHFTIQSISHCGLDPEDRKFTQFGSTKPW